MYYDIHTGEEITDADMEQRYVDMLDECHGDVTIAGMTYQTSRALKDVDPIAYRVGMSDYISSEIGETIVESGYWVRAITDDGVMHDDGEPVWYVDEIDARRAFDDLCEIVADPDAENVVPVTVQAYGTDDGIIAETRIDA